MIDLTPQIVARLVSEFAFKQSGEHLREGRCPSCNKKSLWTWAEKPGMVQCNRTNNCNWAMTSKELFPDLFENLNKKYPATTNSPTQTADAYLSLVRGFDVSKINGWYEQGKYWHPNGDKGTATVRFYLDAAKTVMWERLIDDVTLTAADGDQETRNKNFKGSFKGLWWQPPGFSINKGDEIYWCEGILDAIALNLNGYKAVAIMSSGTFPDAALALHLGKEVRWIIAVDNDETGRRCLAKHVKKLREMREHVAAVLSSDTETKQDWNDLHKLHMLTKEHMQQYRFFGSLEIAKSSAEKGLVIWRNSNKKPYFVFDHNNITYSIKVDAEEFEKRFGDADTNTMPEWEQGERESFIASSKIKPIATFKWRLLYVEEQSNGEPSKYTFMMSFSNNSPAKVITLTGSQLSSASKFKEAMMLSTASAIFTGTTPDLDYKNQEDIKTSPKIVRAIDFVGYDSDTKAYVYNDYAVENNKILRLNKESFFQLKHSGIKTTSDIKQYLNNRMIADWLPDFQVAFGVGGMVALSWWLGCLFAQQVRGQHRSYPYFELIGEAASGKSALVDFLWKLFGRENDTFNPNSSSLAGRTRKLAEVSNIPVVFNETDNENNNADKNFKKFLWDEYKELYDGGKLRVTAVKTQDNTTKNPSFKGALMIVQNIPVEASEAMITRIVHLNFDRTHHSDLGMLAAQNLRALPILHVSGFLLHAVTKADELLKLFNTQLAKHTHHLQANPKLKLQRIIDNHAKIMAFADCLPMLLPVSNDMVLAVHTRLESMAEARSNLLADDHPIVQKFWNTFDYLNSKAWGTDEVEDHTMNHSRHPEIEIAVSLEHFHAQCIAAKQDPIDPVMLLRHIKTSRVRQYLRHEPMHSRIEKRTIRCWIFKR